MKVEKFSLVAMLLEVGEENAAVLTPGPTATTTPVTSISGHRALARGWWGEGHADEVSGVHREAAERGTQAIPAQASAGG